MKKYLVGILAFVTIIFCLNGIKGETLRKSGIEISVPEQTTDYTNRNCIDTTNSEYEAVTGNAYLSFDILNSKICNVLFSTYSSPRGVSYPKNLKFNSTIQVLSSLNIPLYTRDSKDQYFHHCFAKASYRYFIYTLRRLLI